jgi:hypothetical protein
MGGCSAPDPNHYNIKTLQSVDHTHQITSNGTYELPFGTDHTLLGGAPGWVQNIVSKWQLGGIMNFNTGAPLILTASGTQTITNTNAFPDLVGAFPKSVGHITKLAHSVQYFNGYSQIVDPGFAQVSPTCAASTANCNGLVSLYSNKAIADSNGNVVLMNPQPGTAGTLGPSNLRGPKFFDIDMNLVKRFRMTERTQFEFRIDAINVLNHPYFSAPSLNINGVGTFGQITSLATSLVGNGMRSFIINSRVNF